MIYPADQGERLMRTIRDLKLHIARQCRAVSRPGGEAKLLLLELWSLPCRTEEMPEIPIETEQGKFSLDGYR